MANICITEFIIVGRRESLEKLKNFLEKVHNKVEKDSYTLYNSLEELGVDYSGLDFNRRASLVDIFITQYDRPDTLSIDNALVFTTESAWTAPIEMISMIMDALQLKEDTSVNYIAEEPDCNYWEFRNPDNVFEVSWNL